MVPDPVFRFSSDTDLAFRNLVGSLRGELSDTDLAFRNLVGNLKVNRPTQILLSVI